jgi:hypothetical protein
MEDSIARKFNALSGSLNERQRRLWAAAETLNLGRGAISVVSRATGISRPTSTRGIKEMNLPALKGGVSEDCSLRY